MSDFQFGHIFGVEVQDVQGQELGWSAAWTWDPLICKNTKLLTVASYFIS